MLRSPTHSHIESEGHPRIDDAEPQHGNATNLEISSADDDEEDSDGKSTANWTKKMGDLARMRREK